MRPEIDASRSLQSPSQSYSNGSGMRSPDRTVRLGKIANGSSTKEESNGSISHTNGASARLRRTETFFGHDREEVTRILIQSLSDLGYHNAAESLISESGYELEGPTVAAFRSAVLGGEWAEAEALLFGLHSDGVSLYEDGPPLGKSNGKAAKSSWYSKNYTKGLTLAESADKNEMRFWMRQQKYLELLEQRDIGAALMVLRQELTPLHQDVSRLHSLSSLMMCGSAEDLRQYAQWDGAAGQSRKHLLSELSKRISPSVMIPEHRLAILLDTVKSSWVSSCLYHNTSASPSLYVDHVCDHGDFPRKLDVTLSDHMDEVWYLQYSHNGSRLATAGKDGKVIIYDTCSQSVLMELEHEGGVCYLAWSPDDTKLITCTQEQGSDTTARMWDVGTQMVLLEMTDFTYPVMSAAWAPNGESFVTGSQDAENALIMWDTKKGVKIHQWKEEHLRVDDLAISPDGERLVVATNGTAGRIFVYDYVTRGKVRDWVFDGVRITSVNISRDSKTLLVSVNNNKTKLIDLDTGDTVRNFIGHTQENFVIRSNFGGASETFVVSGSEDNRIYVWRTSGLGLVEIIEAHRGCVNAVSWHPIDPLVFASAGDDGKVKIWTVPGHSLAIRPDGAEP
ncbi:WD40 repeat-like protein [Pseudovirgaria hyperparasitica]|uniref:WD40 repeat-like protein n=1 Tax=Pseudovirgaria hyperparasitica TaxID=470096 RepID=A0A6A6VUS5_9PEZI|nr:WD40 repeat-like protein [Pseudovirgaria hyperparasitica]KAF2753983.1 WD40 repeat-like protein [Pseudovirgaria hyperparasitica]